MKYSIAISAPEHSRFVGGQQWHVTFTVTCTIGSEEELNRLRNPNTELPGRRKGNQAMSAQRARIVMPAFLSILTPQEKLELLQASMAEALEES
jgi:hypothetical protein